MPKPSAYTVKACEAPEVSSRVASGTATEIAIEPSMYITKTSARGGQDGLEVGLRRPLEVLDVDGVDLEAGEGDEGAHDQGDAGQPGEGRGHVADVEGRCRRLAVDQPREHEEDQRAAPGRWSPARRRGC